jgi:hypothetical protein
VNFFERYLGISSDGGDGSAEVLFLVTLFAIIALIAWRLLGLPNVKDDAHAPLVRLESNDGTYERTQGVQLGLIVTILACAVILGGYYLL